MNKHTELVKKWLEDKDSVSLEELGSNAYAASYAAYVAAHAASYAASYAAYHAVKSASDADSYATYHAAKSADWVKRYEELPK